MTIPSTGPITISLIQNEFGGSNPAALTEYYRGGGLVSVDSSAAITQFQKISQNNNQLPDSANRAIYVNDNWVVLRYPIKYAANGLVLYAIDVYFKGYLKLRIDGSNLDDNGLGKSVSIDTTSSRLLVASNIYVYVINLSTGTISSAFKYYNSSYSSYANSIKFLSSGSIIIGRTGNRAEIRSLTGTVLNTITTSITDFGKNLVSSLDRSSLQRYWATVGNDGGYDKNYVYVYMDAVFQYRVPMSANIDHPVSIQDYNLYVYKSGQVMVYDLTSGSLLRTITFNQTYNWVSMDFSNPIGVAVCHFKDGGGHVDVYDASTNSTAPYWTFDTRTESPESYVYGAYCNNYRKEIVVLGLRGNWETRILYQVSHPYPTISMSQFRNTFNFPVSVPQFPDLITYPPSAYFATALGGSGVFTVPQQSMYNYIDVVLVAGGGGGGSTSNTGAWDGGGGGGGGGVLFVTIPVTPGAQFNYVVGAGGAGGIDGYQGNNGNNTTFGQYTAIGGGAGGGYRTSSSNNGSYNGVDGLPGGSGGGAGSYNGYGNPGAGTPPQGFSGGGQNDNGYNGGGGGAGSAGVGTYANLGYSGGTGVQIDLSINLSPGTIFTPWLGAGGGAGGGFDSHGNNSRYAYPGHGGGDGGLGENYRSNSGNSGAQGQGGGGGGAGGSYPDGGGSGGSGGAGVIYLIARYRP